MRNTKWVENGCKETKYAVRSLREGSRSVGAQDLINLLSFCESLDSCGTRVKKQHLLEVLREGRKLL